MSRIETEYTSLIGFFWVNGLRVFFHEAWTSVKKTQAPHLPPMGGQGVREGRDPLSLPAPEQFHLCLFYLLLYEQDLV